MLSDLFDLNIGKLEFHYSWELCRKEKDKVYFHNIKQLLLCQEIEAILWGKCWATLEEQNLTDRGFPSGSIHRGSRHHVGHPAHSIPFRRSPSSVRTSGLEVNNTKALESVTSGQGMGRIEAVGSLSPEHASFYNHFQFVLGGTETSASCFTEQFLGLSTVLIAWHLSFRNACVSQTSAPSLQLLDVRFLELTSWHRVLHALHPSPSSQAKVPGSVLTGSRPALS